jgi:hypothetical protein
LVLTPLLFALYIRVFFISRKQRRKIDAMDKSEDKMKQGKRKAREYKATLLTIVVSVMAFCLWSPYFITSCVLYFSGNTPLVQTMMHISVTFGVLNSAVNFFIYALMNTELRTGFAKVWGIDLKQENQLAQTSFSLNKPVN